MRLRQPSDVLFVDQNFFVKTANFQASRQALWKAEQTIPEKCQTYLSTTEQTYCEHPRPPNLSAIPFAVISLNGPI